ncbi:hypothetical protein OJ253_1725 [Cryptosporidium canis]|uniref:Uncharacterized protein n=1 Tax=Cryptosporidium canis TaxID=195482 RepID=A0A9D5DJF7_9CRYT|nr:hypothetical protein OJ253_1725 [Cryptosporidium canis]
MKTAFKEELSLMNNYYDGPPQQSPRLMASESEVSGFSMDSIFKVTSVLSGSDFDYGLFGIADARASLATSYFIGFGSFIGFILVIALIRGIYLASKRRRDRSEYTNPNSERFIVRSSDDVVSNNYGSEEFPAISYRTGV